VKLANPRSGALCIVLLAGCAASPPRAAAPSTSAPESGAMVQASATTSAAAPQLESSEDYTQLLTESAAVDASFMGAPNCPSACKHLGALCDIAERICGLALQEPDESLEQQCADGRTRCKSARDKTRSAACACD
jgi:hypothetical protein